MKLKKIKKEISNRVNALIGVKGYKAFEYDTEGNFPYCRDYHFKPISNEQQNYKMEGKAAICDHGFHFCPNFKNIAGYYPFRLGPDRKYAEVLGRKSIDKEIDVSYSGKKDAKVCATELVIKRWLTDEEAFDLQFPKIAHHKGTKEFYKHNPIAYLESYCLNDQYYKFVRKTDYNESIILATYNAVYEGIEISYWSYLLGKLNQTFAK